jgi:hypothetical protein
VRLDPGEVASFGLRFDAPQAPYAGAASTGIEGYASVPLYFHWVRLDGWYTHLSDTGGRPFLPRDFAAASLQYHDTFFTGNLEPTARIETVFRGPAAFPDSTGALTGLTTRYAMFNFFLQIRIIDVRVFVRSDNLINRRTAQDIPGYFLPGSRTMYGFRWFFRN